MATREEQLKELVINQFQDDENFLEIMKIVSERIEDSDNILSDLSLKTWTQTAIGVWLDWRGDWVGVNRPKKFEPDATVFTVRALAAPDDPAKGISGLASPTGGKLAGVNGLQLDEFADDVTYRTYIEAKEISTDMASNLKNVVLFCQKIGIQVDVSVPVAGFIMVTPQAATTREQREIIKLLAPRLGGVFLRISQI